MANFVYVRQGRHLPYGNGTPLLCVKELLRKGERFVYMFGDDLVLSKTPCTKQIIDYSEKKNKAVTVAVQKVPRSEVHRYGIYRMKKGSKDKVKDAVEKPDPAKVKSRMAQFGRFVLNTDIVRIINNHYKQDKLGKDKELWLIDSIIEYAKTNPVFAARIEGEWLTTGDPLRYMKAQVKYALNRKELHGEFHQFLKELAVGEVKGCHCGCGCCG